MPPTAVTPEALMTNPASPTMHRTLTPASRANRRVGTRSGSGATRGRRTTLITLATKPRLRKITHPWAQRRAYVATILMEEPSTKPGTEFLYSNAGYGLLGHLAEKRGGQPFEALMRKMLFEPLGMQQTGFGVPDKVGVDQPKGHCGAPPKLRVQKPGEDELLPFLRPAGDIHASMADLTRFGRLHLGAGKNIRTAELPLLYTRKMAHHFMLAPSDYSIVEALRWGQVHGLGGDAQVVRALRGTRICTSVDNDEFWVSVLRFFIQNPMLDTAHYCPILDFVHNQKFVGDEVTGADGRLRTIPPPKPGFTMHGRTPPSLVQQVETWHGGLGYGSSADSGVTWKSNGIPAFRSVEGQSKPRIWTSRELCSKAQLAAEGRRMNHCVATYASSCRCGQASIWTMEVEDKDGLKKVATIEVANAISRIVQVSGRANRKPSTQVRTLLGRWASAAGLTISSWI